MEIRKSTQQDVDEILKIYDIARDYMKKHGNPTQWNSGYPGKDLLLQDIRQGVNYSMLDGEKIAGTFTFIIGAEPTYRVIECGAWSCKKPYGTIHRLASAGMAKGIAGACFDFCTGLADYVRIDTHKDNLVMQSVIEKYGFHRCGIIHVKDGTERIAYDYVRMEKMLKRTENI